MGDCKRMIDLILLHGNVSTFFKEINLKNAKIQDIIYDGVNAVTASLAANLPHEKLFSLVKSISENIVSNKIYFALLNEKVFTILPGEAAELQKQGLLKSPDDAKKYSKYYDIFDIFVPTHPLPVIVDIFDYLYKRGYRFPREKILHFKELLLHRHCKIELDIVFSKY